MSDSLPDTGALIYIATKPLIKFALPVAAGYFLAARDLFPLAASRGAGQLILNILLPALLFSKVVLSIDIDNVSALGPIVLVGTVYTFFGLLVGWIVRLIFPVPKNFRNGLLVAGMLGNWGDLPFAILQTVTASSPFNGATDPTLAQAYASVFLVMFLVIMFPMRTIDLLARDYRYPCGGQETEPYLMELLSSFRAKRQSAPASPRLTPDDAKDVEADKATGIATAAHTPSATAQANHPQFYNLTQQPTNRTTRSNNSSIMLHEMSVAGAAPYSLAGRPAPRTVFELPEEPTRPNSPIHFPTQTLARSVSRLSRFDVRRFGRTLAHESLQFLKALATPPTISLALAITIALVRPLKALFVPVANYDIRQAPDGKACLDVIYQVTVFLGDAAVPSSLIILGSALARIKVPKPFSRLPIRAMVALAIGKLVIMPIFGVGFVQALTYHTDLIAPSNRVLRYTLLVLSCVPSPTQQIVLTVVVCPEDEESNADIFGCFLIVQYCVLVFSMTILAAYSLSLIF